MKPVKLEILTALNGAGLDDLSGRMGEAKKDLESLSALQREYIAGLRQELSVLKKKFADSSDAQAMKPLAASISELEGELKDAEFALKILDKTIEENAGSTKTLRTQIRELEMEMADMTEGTEEYRLAMERLGQLRDRMSDISQQGRVLADDEQNIRAAADAISGLSGAMTAGVGIASLFGVEQEKLQQIQTRLQAVMATTIGLQQVAQTLNKDSYFSIKILQGAKRKWAAAQALLNTQLGIGVGLSKAFMVSGVGLLLLGIAKLVSLYGEWRKKQEEVNALKRQFVELETDVAKAMAKSKVKAEQLHLIAKDRTKDYEMRAKAIDRLKSIMPQYNAHISREGVLVDNSNTSLKNYLVTLYKVEKAKKLLASIEEDQGSLDAMKKTGSAPLSFWERMWIGLNASFDPNAGDKVMDELLTTKSKRWVDGMNKLEESIKEKRKSFDELVKDKSVFKILFDDEKEKRDRTLPENKLAKQRLSAYRKIKEMEVSIMAEGEKKRKAQAKLEYTNRLAEIAQEKSEREKHVKELAKAKIPVSKEEISEIDNQAREQSLLAKQMYDNKVREIDRETAAGYASIQAELRQNFASRLDAQLADADAYYSDLRKKAGANIELIARIETARVQAKRQITHEAQLRELELDNEIARRRQELDDSRVLLATDRQEKILRIELSGAEKRLAKLKEMEREGMETAEDIKLTRAEIEKLSAALKKIPVDRVREIGGHLKNWLSSLGSIGGEVGESLSAISAGVDDVISSLDKEATTLDHIGGAINGLVRLYSLAARQLEENRQRQREWSEAIEESAHRARMMRIEEKTYREANVFGVENPYAKAISGAQQYRDAMTELNASLHKLSGGQVQIGTKKVFSGKNAVSGAASGAGIGAAVGSIIPGVGTAVGAAIGGFLGGIFGASRKKVVPVLNSLSAQYGSILKEGSETFELNPRILEDYNKLDEATKKMVDNWNEIREKAIEAQEQMRQTFRDLAGDIGNSLSSALVESFRNGDLFAAVDKFQEKITGTIEGILQQLVFSAHFQKMFDELASRMEKSFDTGGDGSITDDIIWFSNNYKDKIAAYGKSMEQMRDELKKQGFDVFQAQASNRTAAARGIAQASQESVDENNGRLTYIQGVITRMEQGQTKLVEYVFRIFAPLNRIAENTDRLEAIEAATKKTTAVLEKIEKNGMKIQ